MKFWKWKKEKSPVSLNQLIEKFQQIIVDSQKKFEDYQLNRLERFYNEDKSPIVKKFLSTDSMHTKEVPLLLLVNHQLLRMKEISISFNIKVKDLKTLENMESELKQDGISLEIIDNRKKQNLAVVKLIYSEK